MKRLLSIILVAFATVAVANAVIVQKVILKNGSVLEGYIQSQDGSGRMTVHTDRAVIYISSDKADVFDRNTKFIALSDDWKEWAEKHDAFEGRGDDRTLMLNDVSFKDVTVADSVVSAPAPFNFEKFLTSSMHSVSKVKVLERGVMVKYLELAPNSYQVSWDDIQSIKADRRPKNALSGIDRIYTLRNGKTYEGQYAGETDNSLSLYMPGGVVQSFNTDDVVKYVFRGINPNQDLFEQSELLDVIKTASGATVRGIILEQNYASKKDAENLFLIQMESGAIQTIKVSEIKELLKEENSKYNPKFDIMLNNGEVVINRKATTSVKVDEDDDILVLNGVDKVEKKVEIERGGKGLTKVTVEYRMDGNANVEVFKLVRVTQSKVKREDVYSFSYKDLVNAVYRPIKMETSVNGTTSAEYELSGTGMFALYDARNKKAIPFIIK